MEAGMIEAVISAAGSAGIAVVVLIWLTKSLFPAMQADLKNQREQFVEVLKEQRGNFQETLLKLEEGCKETQIQAVEAIRQNATALGRVEKALENKSLQLYPNHDR